MTIDRAPRHVAFGTADGVPMVTWSTDGTGMDSRTRESAFEAFPNVSTPTELFDVLELLPCAPISPLMYRKGFESMDDPELLLDVFGMEHTRKNVNDAKDLLAIRAYQNTGGWQYAIPLADFVVMINDMKALLTILIYAYGKRPRSEAALEMNTRNDFGFLYQWEGRRSAYGEYLQRVRYEELFELEPEHESITKNIARAIGMHGRKPPRKTIADMTRFAESSINGFMWSVNPTLSNGEYYNKSKGDGLGSIYDFWAERIAVGKALVCPTCGKLVAHPRKNQQFCSKSCGVRDFKKRTK